MTEAGDVCIVASGVAAGGRACASHHCLLWMIAVVGVFCHPSADNSLRVCLPRFMSSVWMLFRMCVVTYVCGFSGVFVYR